MMTSQPISWRAVQPSLERLRLRVEISAWRNGWLWPLATLILLLATGVAIADAMSQRAGSAELAAARRSLAAKQLIARPAPVVGPTDESSRQREVQALDVPSLESVLPPLDRADTELRRLYELAGQQAIAIPQADFQKDGGTGGISRVQIRIPTKASYPQLRAFVESVLRDMPNLSLDRISFRREQVGATQVEAQLNFSLWLSAAVPADTSASAASTTGALLKPSK